MKNNTNSFSFSGSKSYLFGALLLAVIGLISWIYTNQIQYSDTASDIAKTIAIIDKEIDQAFDDCARVPTDQLFLQLQDISSSEDDLAYLVFEEDSLIAWSNHSTESIHQLQLTSEEIQCLRLNNGYYLAKHRRVETLDLYALCLIKNAYPYENNYLRNSFAKRFNTSDNPEISLDLIEGSKAVKIGDKPIFYIHGSTVVHENEYWNYISWILFLFSTVFLIQGLAKVSKLKERNLRLIPLFILGLLVIRVLFYYLTRYLNFDQLKLFDPEIFASSDWFPSLGDFLVTGLFLYLGSHFILKWVRYKSVDRDIIGNPINSMLGLGLFYTLGHWVNHMFKTLVEDSNISFNINNFFNLSPYSIIGIIIIGFLLFAMYYLGQSNRVYHIRIPSKSARRNVIVISTLLYVATMVLLGIVDWMMILWPVVLLVIIIVLGEEKKNLLSIRIILLTVLTIYGSYMFEKYAEIKGKKKLVILSDKLSINNDIIAENLFTRIETKLNEDPKLHDRLYKIANKEHQQYGELIDQYFKGYWNRYKINMYLFDSLGTPLYNATNLTNKLKIDLDSSIIEASYSTLDGLYMVNPEDKHLSYLYHKLVTKENLPDYEMYLEFEYKFVTEELGFPELLIKGNAINKEYYDYSVARYLDNRLVSQKGIYPYLRDQEMETHHHVDSLYNKSGYMHYVVRKSPYTFVISKARDTWLNKITDFTYLYSIFGLMFVIFIALDRWSSGEWRTKYSLQIKIQALVISIVLISLLFFGLGSYYYIVTQNKEKNENLLREKVSSVLIELSHKLKKENAMDDDVKIAKYLTKFSNVFFTDINIYGLDGHLRASSRPQLFDQGIISTRMNPEAFYALAILKSSRYTLNETIGSLDYISSYVPFYGENNQVLAYLNLPYFARQVELEQELSAFVVAIINILVILFILSAFGALFVSRLITSPLKVIQDNLSEISLDSSNKPIKYSGNDEIGTLVNAYNDKLNELREKAEELAKSERETAWREMAKQVAHEIKNPLTPMKLSIQYLQRTWKDNSEDWEDRFHRSTATLIEQIDTLSSIATAFGDFAKMPKTQDEKIDLKMILDQVIALFTQNVVEASLHFECDLAGPQYVYADKDQMTRVFNNLIKNAIQSIPSDQEGIIIIKLILKGFQYIVEIEDNGIGIPLDQQEKIFVPNFTTKSTGTGLGLAMVKSIVENAGGKVWFSTSLGKGTSFYVSIDKEGE